MSCLCCSWASESHRFPHHAITNHPESIQFCRVQFDHCAYLYLKNGKQEKEFTVCLSCHAGTVYCPSSGNGSRWVSRHAKSSPCKSAHEKAIIDFKKYCSEALARVTIDTEHTPHTRIVTDIHIQTIWERCKTNRHIKDMFVETEEKLKEIALIDMDEDDPVEYLFDPVEGFSQIAMIANSYKKNYTMTKQEMQAMMLKHDSELVEHRREILTQRTIIQNQGFAIVELKEELKYNREEMEAMREKIKLLEAKLEPTVEKTE